MRPHVPAVCLFLLPVAGLAQPQTGVTDNLPQSSAFWTAFMTVVALPFLSGAAKLVLDMFIAWRTAKGDKRAAAYARYKDLAADAFAYVNAQTQATRLRITSSDSEGGRNVTPAEAKQYQDAARAAFISWVGQGGVQKVADEVGIAAGSAEEWIRGIIQSRFDAHKLATKAAESNGMMITAEDILADPGMGGALR